VYSIPEEVAEVERSEVPSTDTLVAMFPDIGDDFEVDVWILTVNKMTRETIQEQKEIMKAKMQERLAKIEEIKKARSKFTQLNFSSPEPASNTTTAEESNRRKRQADNSTAENSSADNSTAAPTTTTEVPKRVDVSAVLPNTHGYGVRAGNTSNLLDAVACNTCGLPANRKRKFLYLSTSPFDDGLADPTNDNFKAKKLAIETEVIFYQLTIY
jgi:hypothetical protein